MGTREGAFLTVLGVGAAGQPSVSTNHVTGSTGWEDISAEFAAGPETRLAQVVLVRPGVSADEPPASGQVCLAEVQWRQTQSGVHKMGTDATAPAGAGGPR